MSELTVVIKKENSDFESKLFFSKGESLLLLCQKSGIKLNFPCGGKGICGKCKVLFEKGAPIPTASERRWLSPDEMRNGVRLACMTTLTDDCIVCLPKECELAIIDDTFEIPFQTMNRLWQNCDEETSFMVSIDLGTTTIVMQKCNLLTGKVVATYKAVNPQRQYGADIISRLEASIEGSSDQLADAVREELENGMKELGLHNIKIAVLAGNTAMIHLLMNYDVTTLAAAPFVPNRLDEITTEIGGITTYIMPGISAFIGADIVAGLSAVRSSLLIDGTTDVVGESGEDQVEIDDGIRLLVDLGTNAEMVLFDKNKAICTATAAGCAFDGIADAGLFGADVVAILHHLYEKGIVDSYGTLCESYFESGYSLDDYDVILTQDHIRQLQLAKAAVRCGIDYLTERFGCRIEDIDSVFLAGGFGYYLDKKAAIAIGLLPPIAMDKIISCGNTALPGATLYGMQKNCRIDCHSVEKLLQLHHIEAMNLAMEPDFANRYIAYLDLDH